MKRRGAPFGGDVAEIIEEGGPVAVHRSKPLKSVAPCLQRYRLALVSAFTGKRGQTRGCDLQLEAAILLWRVVARYRGGASEIV